MKLNMEELVPLITEVINSGAIFKLYPHGQSMLPTIEEGVDAVDLSYPFKLKKYDIVLYKREEGKYVLHRIVKEHGEYYDMCGDAQLDIEKNVPKSNVIAVVSAIHRKDKILFSTDFLFYKEAVILYRIKAFKRFIRSCNRFIYKIYKVIFKK